MNVSALSAAGTLGVRTENTIDALKKELGAERLSVVVVGDLDEYVELLVEVPPPSRWSWRKRIIVGISVLVALVAFSGLVHPGVRIDRLVKHISVQVH